MWLLDTYTLKLRLYQTPPTSHSGGPYAILSHVWSRGGEESFQDLKSIVDAGPLLTLWQQLQRLWGRSPLEALQNDVRISAKIRNCCAFARAMGYKLLWIDTCCIDKTSSAELSEAINSMYEWYARAAVCFAFLHDVGDDQDPSASSSEFRRSSWFSRGWTLQELIAPRDILFLSRDWTMIGTKENLADVIEEITGVQRTVLLFEETPASVSVSRRMSWASNRCTTRVEDEAYSLLGLFGICMPTIYGEGRNAFLRLQEEILRNIPDQTIFIWGSGPALVFDESKWNNITNMRTVGVGVHETIDLHGRVYASTHTHAGPSTQEYLLADTPSLFHHSSRFSPISFNTLARRLGSWQLDTPQYTITSYGVRMSLPIIPVQSWTKGKYLAVLACEDGEGRLVALALSKHSEEHLHTVGFYYYNIDLHNDGSWSRRLNSGGLHRTVLLPTPLERTHASSTLIAATDICIAHRPTLQGPASGRFGPVETRRGGRQRAMFTGPCTIFIPPWTLSQLAEAGWVPTWAGGNMFPLGMSKFPLGFTESRLVFVVPRARLRISIFANVCSGITVSGITPWVGDGSRPRSSLHATLTHSGMDQPEPSLRSDMYDCPSRHVADWEAAAKTWDIPTIGSVTLRFRDWPCGRGSSVEGAMILPLYSLEVQVHDAVNLPPPRTVSWSQSDF